jgi:predicted anti-sigma-YlaC factor YlaD
MHPYNPPFDDHVEEAALEDLALRRLSEEQIAPIEEHLLLCEWCRERLQRISDMIDAMRTLDPSWMPSRTRKEDA